MVASLPSLCMLLKWERDKGRPLSTEGRHRRRHRVITSFSVHFKSDTIRAVIDRHLCYNLTSLNRRNYAARIERANDYDEDSSLYPSYTCIHIDGFRMVNVVELSKWIFRLRHFASLFSSTKNFGKDFSFEGKLVNSFTVYRIYD